jgi:uncharacterized protein (DUF2141 family)
MLLLPFEEPLTLKVEVQNLRNTKGQVLLELLDENENSIKGISKEIVNNKCLIVIDSLSPGKYAFKYFHDENGNRKIDANLIGIPKEGFGFSNNAKGTFGPPSHEKMIFDLTGDTTLHCSPTYIR